MKRGHYYYYYPCYHIYAGYLQLYTWNKPCFLSIQCCSCSLCTICATCNVISPVKYVVYFYISTSRSMCAVPNMAVFFCSSLISCFLGGITIILYYIILYYIILYYIILYYIILYYIILYYIILYYIIL